MTTGLRLDYKRRPARPRLSHWIVAGAAVIFGYDVASQYVAFSREVAEKEALLAKVPTSASAPAPASQSTTDEIAFARETIRRLSTPWERLFAALEAAQIDGVALLSVEPDAEGRTVSVTGEAKDYLATLTYVGHLNEESALRRVHLVRHEARQGTERPVLFTVSAAWRQGR